MPATISKKEKSASDKPTTTVQTGDSKFIKFIKWLFGRSFYDRSDLTPEKTFLLTMRVTTKCRYNAANRLINLNRFSFLTTTVLSLGLIFIPLVQNSGISINIKPGAINMMQIFLAVAVLVYSIIIGTSQYELRAEKLAACGDSLKELIRELSKKIKKESISDNELDEYQKTYTHIISRTENQSTVDYIRATLEMGRDYKITGFKRASLKLESIFRSLIPYYIPLFMLIMEAVFIYYMLAPSSVPAYLRK